jgi:hypothetical protein
MSLRDLVLNNFRWKLTALLLAMLVWFVIKVAIYKGATSGPNQMLRHQPVMVLKAPDDPRSFRIDPPQVDVAVQGAKELGADDLQVFVNLTTWPEDLPSALRPVLVRAADSAKVHVQPLFVMVERVTPTEAALGNPVKKP